MDNPHVRIHAGLDLRMLRCVREAVASRDVISFSSLKDALRCDAVTLRRHVDYWMSAGHLECLFPSHVIGRKDYDPERFPVFYRWARAEEDPRSGLSRVKQAAANRKPPLGYRVLRWWKRNNAPGGADLNGLLPEGGGRHPQRAIRGNSIPCGRPSGHAAYHDILTAR